MWAAVCLLLRQKRKTRWNGLESYVFNIGLASCCHSVFRQLEFPVENGVTSPDYIIWVQRLVIFQMQFVFAVCSVINTVNRIWIFSFVSNCKFICEWKPLTSSHAICFSLIFHLRYLRKRWFCWALPLLACPVMDFPPDILRSSSDPSQRVWIPFNISLHSDLFRHHSLLPPPLFFSLSSTICSSQAWWRNLIRAEGERQEGASEGRK